MYRRKPGERGAGAASSRTAFRLHGDVGGEVGGKPLREGVEGSTYLAQPFKQAFCMASMVYRRNSCASSWFPKRKCRAISGDGQKHQTGRRELTPSPPVTHLRSFAPDPLLSQG